MIWSMSAGVSKAMPKKRPLAHTTRAGNSRTPRDSTTLDPTGGAVPSIFAPPADRSRIRTSCIGACRAA
jgi:hypothetical protein